MLETERVRFPLDRWTYLPARSTGPSAAGAVKPADRADPPATAPGETFREPSAPSVPIVSGERRVLLLQGPVGPFFTCLGESFAARGYVVDRISFNGADGFWAKRPNGVMLPYRSGIELLEPWLRATMSSARYEMVLLFGCQRPVHVAARAVAEERGVPVVSLEEGYIRTGFVTVELGANNAGSPVAGALPDAMDHRYRLSPEVRPKKHWMGTYSAIHFIVRNTLTVGARRELFHKRRPLVPEALRWMRALGRGAAAWGRDRWLGGGRGTRMSVEHADGYDLVILQVHDDAQMGAAARGWTNEKLVQETIESFARFAPADRRLLFKIHPHERGHTKDHRLIEELSERWNVADRVAWVYTGALSRFVERARGMIVINSTSGLSAIDKGCPLLVLGDAIYANPALARIGGDASAIDGFWRDDHVAPVELRRAYRGWLVERSMVVGDYYVPQTMRLTADNVADRAIALVADAAATSPGGEVVPFPSAP